MSAAVLASVVMTVGGCQRGEAGPPEPRDHNQAIRARPGEGITPVGARERR